MEGRTLEKVKKEGERVERADQQLCISGMEELDAVAVRLKTTAFN